MSVDWESAVPDRPVNIRETFGVDVDGDVLGFAESSEYVPAIDPGYRFDPRTTMALLAGFSHDKRVLLQGRHGTGKSSHVEQIAARLNWPCIRLNLDSHISRIDMIGKDAIVLREGKQITEYREGLLPWCYQRPVALVLDEYDAGRPDVMFVIQRVLEASGRLTILDQNRVLSPHPLFRLFATANTVGLGDVSGLYHGTQQLNQAQLDRWNVIVRLDYLSEDEEAAVVLSKVPLMGQRDNPQILRQMIRMAAQTRVGFEAGDISTLMSPRGIISWGENYQIFGDVDYAFEVSFLNRCDQAERPIFVEYYQRCFGRTLSETGQQLWSRVPTEVDTGKFQLHR
jgi:cobaltochelatase CobS